MFVLLLGLITKYVHEKNVLTVAVEPMLDSRAIKDLYSFVLMITDISGYINDIPSECHFYNVPTSN